MEPTQRGRTGSLEHAQAASGAGSQPEAHEVPAASPDGAAGPHLSESMHLDSWIRLLVGVSTLLLLLLLVAIVVRLVMVIGHTVLLFSLGGLIAYAFDPLVELVRGSKQRPRWFGVTAVFAGLFLLVALGAFSLSHELVYQSSRLAFQRPQIQAEGIAKLRSVDSWLAERHIVVSLESYITRPPPGLRDWEERLAGETLRSVGRVSASILESAIVLLITLYFLIYSSEMRQAMERALPDRFRPYAAHWRTDVNRILGGFVRGQIALAVVTGAAAAIGCLALGVPYWLLIGLFVVFASLIPVFGPYIGALPALVSAGLASSPGHILTPTTRVIAVLVLFVILNEAGSKILYPRLVGSALGLHEVLVLFVLFAGLEVAGIWGVLFAAPLTALVIVTIVQLVRLWEGKPPVSLAQKARESGAEARERGTP